MFRIYFTMKVMAYKAKHVVFHSLLCMYTGVSVVHKPETQHKEWGFPDAAFSDVINHNIYQTRLGNAATTTRGNNIFQVTW